MNSTKDANDSYVETNRAQAIQAVTLALDEGYEKHVQKMIEICRRHQLEIDEFGGASTGNIQRVEGTR